MLTVTCIAACTKCGKEITREANTEAGKQELFYWISKPVKCDDCARSELFDYNDCYDC